MLEQSNIFNNTVGIFLTILLAITPVLSHAATLNAVTLDAKVSSPTTAYLKASATFSDVVVNHPCKVWVMVEYGIGSNLNKSTSGKCVRSGATATWLIKNLSEGTEYSYRVVAGIKNSDVRDYGDTKTFSTTGSKTSSDSSVTTGGTSSGYGIDTYSSTDVYDDSASLRAAVRPDGLNVKVWFQWGKTSYANRTPKIETNRYETVEAVIEGLKPDTTYMYRAVMSSSRGTVYGNGLVFKTKPAGYVAPIDLNGSGDDNEDSSDVISQGGGVTPVVSQPYGPTDIGSYSTTLNATVLPGGVASSVWFEYGTSRSLGNSTSPQTIPPTRYKEISEEVDGLVPGTTYYYRSVLKTDSGIARSPITTFTTSSSNASSGSSGSSGGSALVDVSGDKNDDCPCASSEDVDGTSEEDSSDTDSIVGAVGEDDDTKSDEGTTEKSSPVLERLQTMVSENEGVFGWGAVVRDSLFEVKTDGRIVRNLAGVSEYSAEKSTFSAIALPSLFGESLLPDSILDWIIIIVVLFVVIARAHAWSNARRKRKEDEQKRKQEEEARYINELGSGKQSGTGSPADFLGIQA